jgi:hypothetical protein
MPKLTIKSQRALKKLKYIEGNQLINSKENIGSQMTSFFLAKHLDLESSYLFF